MSEEGLVVARYRRHAAVQDQAGERYMCQIQRRSLRPVVGDRVAWAKESDDSGTVTKVLPRESELRRVNARGRAEVVAANLSQLVIVLAPEPTPEWFVLDRYLCAAELMSAKSLILLNKVDLITESPSALAGYETIGYPVFRSSAREGTGLEALTKAMQGDRSAIVGQSGVGKSSLINVLLGDTLQRVGELSKKSGHGRHTTTTSVLYQLPGGGELIDSPGVRDYAPYIEDPRAIEQGFREFPEYASRCRFDDCRHRTEPDCAVKTAVSAGGIEERRYASYEKLYVLTEQLLSKR